MERKATFTPDHTERQIRDKKLLWLQEEALLAASEYGEKFDNADEEVPVVIVEELYKVPTAQEGKHNKEQGKQRKTKKIGKKHARKKRKEKKKRTHQR